MKLTLFRQNSDLLESKRDSIIHNWLAEEKVKKILSLHEIQTEEFSHKFAYKVLDHFIAIAKGHEKVGDCPIMADFLQFLRDKDITPSELFSICIIFRKAMIKASFELNIMSQALYEEISSVFDENFGGVLDSFGNTIKKAESELAKTEQLLSHYKQAIDTLSIVSITDADGIITYVNDAFCEVSGYARSELLGRSHNIIRHEDTSDIFLKVLWQTITSGKIFHDTIKNKTNKGEAYYVDSVIVPIKDQKGIISGFISVRHDITNNITSMENALNSEEEALAAKASAEAAEKSKDDFLAAMSHEIRTPLNAILGFVTILQKSRLPAKEAGYLDIIDSSGQSLLSIINDILDFAKIRSGKFEIDPFECDPIDEIEHTVDLFSSKMIEKGIEFITFIDPTLPSCVRMDGLRIRQIISNFLSNAIKFTSENGLIHLRAFFDTQLQRLSIYVQDNGIGIKHENIDKVFGAFSQEESSTSRRFGGTGLGLSICKSLAELMEGTVGVDSIERKGSTFFLHIPVQVVRKRTLVPLVSNIAVNAHEMNAHQYKLLHKYCEALNIKIKDASDISALKEAYPIVVMGEHLFNLHLNQNILDQKSFILLSHIHSDYDALTPTMKRLYFPLTPSKLSTVLRVDREDEKITIIEASKGYKGHLLVAEDNITNQQLIMILLGERGISFDLAKNGKEALDLFKKGSYDLVLMDNNMPIMGGIEATQLIIEYEAQNFQNRKTPIVALTANATTGDRERLLSCGMADFLSKPIDISELDRVLEQYLNLDSLK